MPNEIKEILDYVFSLAIGESYTCEYEDIQKARDYITNLQKEVRINNDLIPYLKNKEKSLKKQITNLQEENERLKLEKDTKCASEILCECLHNEYKSRNEKAIEYIKEKDWYLPLWECRDNQPHQDELLNILEGDDKSE